MTTERITPYVTRIVAPNPGPMTLDGTNTWILRAPVAGTNGRPTSTSESPGTNERPGTSGGAPTRPPSVVVDPGPLIEEHLQAVLDAAAPVAVVLLTHRHPDHSEGAAWFANQAGCGVCAVDPAFRIPADHAHGLTEGAIIMAGELRVEVLPTPGHTSDSVCFWVPEDGSLLTGDTVLGRGTSVVAHPDGALGPYLESLEGLRGFANSPAGVSRLLPGHGPVITDPGAVLTYYLEHRRDRLNQVRTAVAAGHTTPEAVVEHVYADVDRSLWPAAERSVRAQLEYLNKH